MAYVMLNGKISKFLKLFSLNSTENYQIILAKDLILYWKDGGASGCSMCLGMIQTYLVQERDALVHQIETLKDGRVQAVEHAFKPSDGSSDAAIWES